jgi:hypothetical protein
MGMAIHLIYPASAASTTYRAGDKSGKAANELSEFAVFKCTIQLHNSWHPVASHAQGHWCCQIPSTTLDSSIISSHFRVAKLSNKLLLYSGLSALLDLLIAD